MSDTRPLFEIRDLSKRYDQQQVLDHLSFDVARGECFVILGRSGSGKTVTLRQLNALEPPDGGSVRFEGTEISSLDEADLVPVRRRIAMLFQSSALFDSMNVFDNVAFPLREHLGLAPAAIADRVHQLLRRVGLDDFARRMPAELSGGMRKRAALARALALDPVAVLYDEPSAGLDPMGSASIARLIRETQTALAVTSVVVTHDLVLAQRVANRVALLDAGRFRFLGTWAAAETASDPLLQDFLAGREEQASAA
ncbi:MAG: ABC transporter ATP-binding protein [Acidobacteriota bacterium]